MTTFVKKVIMRYIIVIVLIVLSVFSIKQYDEIKNMRSKMDSLYGKLEKAAVCDAETMKELSNQQYKEDFYLSQLSNTTTLILSVIGFALVFAGISSFMIIDEKFKIFIQGVTSEMQELRMLTENSSNSAETSINAFRKEINNYTSENTKNYKALEHRMLDVKNDLDYEAGILKSKEADAAYLRNDMDSFIFYNLRSCLYVKDNILFYRKTNDKDLEDSSTVSLNIRLKHLNSKLEEYLELKGFEKLSLPSNKKKSYVRYISEINKVGNTDTFELLNQMFTLFDFTAEADDD